LFVCLFACLLNCMHVFMYVCLYVCLFVCLFVCSTEFFHFFILALSAPCTLTSCLPPFHKYTSPFLHFTSHQSAFHLHTFLSLIYSYPLSFLLKLLPSLLHPSFFLILLYYFSSLPLSFYSKRQSLFHPLYPHLSSPIHPHLSSPILIHRHLSSSILTYPHPSSSILTYPHPSSSIPIHPVLQCAHLRFAAKLLRCSCTWLSFLPFLPLQPS
jgi:hypothetical protein